MPTIHYKNCACCLIVLLQRISYHCQSGEGYVALHRAGVINEHHMPYLFTEKKIKMAMPVKEHMTMEKRQQLRLTNKEAINLQQLHKEVWDTNWW